MSLSDVPPKDDAGRSTCAYAQRAKGERELMEPRRGFGTSGPGMGLEAEMTDVDRSRCKTGKKRY